MSKRRGQDHDDNHGKRSRPAHRKHLYLIDPDDDESSRLPEPAALRVMEHLNSDTRVVAMGSDIVIVNGSCRCSDGEAKPTLAYDTAAAALTVGPPLPGRLSGLLVAVADEEPTLYALTTLGDDMPVCFEALSWGPSTRDDEPGLPRTHGWSWKSVASPLPTFDSEGDESIVAYAVHPDRNTVFVSSRGERLPDHDMATYSFDTKRGGPWRWHGAWVLPFQGQGHFDSELDAWVGLDEESGRVCACQVPSRSGAAAEPPELDRMKEKLFSKEGDGTHLGVSLMYAGDGKFCLVERVVSQDWEPGDAGRGQMVNVTVFGLKFNRWGELVTTNRRKVYSYAAPRYAPSFSPVAFWM
ncbi:hypothetical protein EJB05_19919, partial [Eragrostis curvula]